MLLHLIDSGDINVTGQEHYPVIRTSTPTIGRLLDSFATYGTLEITSVPFANDNFLKHREEVN